MSYVTLSAKQALEDENFHNKVYSKNGLNLIFQKVSSTGKDYRKPRVESFAYHVITRVKTQGVTGYECEYRGQYRFALFDQVRLFTVHVQLDPNKLAFEPPKEQGGLM